LDALVADIAFLALHQVQHRKEGGPLLRIARHDLAHLLARLLAQRGGLRPFLGGLLLAHLSTPPITGSMLAIATITSATIAPSHIAAADCRLTNEGSRKCARYGRVPPSDTT